MPKLARTKKAANAPKPVSRRGSARRTRSFVRQVASFMIGTLLLGLCAGGVWFYRTAKPDSALQNWLNSNQAALWEATGNMGMTLEHIFLEGKHHVPGQTLVNALNIRLGQPLLTIPLNETKERLEHVDWIKSATIERRFPNTVFVTITERTPLAIWQKAGKLYLVDDEGTMIEESHLKPFSNLLILVGDDAPLYARGLLDIITKEPTLYKQISAAVRVGERRWNIRFNSGLEVKLPEDHTQAAWDYVIKLQQEKKLFIPGLHTIDLRVADKVYMDMTPQGEPPTGKEEIKEPQAPKHMKN